MTRQESNREILRILMNLNDGCPDLRFGQLLSIAKVIVYKDSHEMDPRSIKGPEVIDPFFEESDVTLKRMKESNR